MKVLVIDAIAPEGIATCASADSRSTRSRARCPKDELHARLGDYEAIVTRSSTAVTPEFLARARRLRILGRAGVGVDNIDVDACSRQGVMVVNAPYGNVVSAAEHTVGMLLALVRKIPVANDALKRLRWDRGIYGSELYRKTVGVLGLGKVGSRVAARLRAFDMERPRLRSVHPGEPRPRARRAADRPAAPCSSRADVLTVHVPLTDETESMIGARELAADEAGRAHRQLRARRHRQRGATCWPRSTRATWRAPRSTCGARSRRVSDLVKRLIAHPQVVVTPHLGANTQEAQVNVAVDVARQLVAFRDGELVEHAVNVPVGDRETMAEQRPVPAPSPSCSGRFCVQLEPDNVERVEVEVAGQVARRDPELIARAVLKGLLEPRDRAGGQSRQRAPGRARARPRDRRAGR